VIQNDPQCFYVDGAPGVFVPSFTSRDAVLQVAANMVSEFRL
jgi:hypothetical protein